MVNEVDFKFIKPDKSLSDFVESFWLLRNLTDGDKEVVVLPDGRIDLIFSCSATEPFHITLLGIGTQPDIANITANTVMFAISFKLLATEYIFRSTVSNFLDGGVNLSNDFWGFNSNDLIDFDFFCSKATEKIQTLLPKEMDNRKQQLFELIYASNGSVTVKELPEKIFWSSRQMARYFNQQFGISLKAYCNILRFRASFQHIKEGKLFPEQNFADQSHFIKQVKQFSGVLPKELKQNQNDRFIQFSTLRGK